MKQRALAFTYCRLAVAAASFAGCGEEGAVRIPKTTTTFLGIDPERLPVR